MKHASSVPAPGVGGLAAAWRGRASRVADAGVAHLVWARDSLGRRPVDLTVGGSGVEHELHGQWDQRGQLVSVGASDLLGMFDLRADQILEVGVRKVAFEADTLMAMQSQVSQWTTTVPGSRGPPGWLDRSPILGVAPGWRTQSRQER